MSVNNSNTALAAREFSSYRENKVQEMSRSQGRPGVKSIAKSHTQVLWGRFTPTTAGPRDCCCPMWTLPYGVEFGFPFI